MVAQHDLAPFFQLDQQFVVGHLGVVIAALFLVIGLQMVPILEPKAPEAYERAKDLGVAFQLANFVRDGRLAAVPLILETPKEGTDGQAMDPVNLAKLRSLLKRRLRQTSAKG